MTNLKGNVALVTGASSGVGRAVAQSLLHAGATVYLVARRRDALEETVAQCGVTEGSARLCVVDLVDDAAVGELVRTIQSEQGALDILVHSAADYRSGAMDTAPASDLDAQWLANVRAPFVLTQSLLPLLRQHNSSVVFMNSRAGLAASPNAGQYSVTKYALKGIADALREELNSAGVRFTSIYLGRVATPMQARAAAGNNKPYVPERLLQPADVAQVVLCVVSLPWTAEVTDIHLRHMMKS